MASTSPAPPTKQPPTDQALKTRIITHMNADHTHSLTLFARHYNRLPAHYARTATMTDINLNGLYMNTSFGRLYIPLNPPLSSLSQARERMVAMHNEACTALDVSGSVTVTSYRFPDRPWMILIFATCLWCLATFPFRKAIHPGSGTWLASAWTLGGRYPALAKLTYDLQPVVYPLMLLIHVTEAVYMAQGRLRRFNVEVLSGVWWSWVLSTFVEGKGSFVRFDEVVAEQEGKGGKGGKH